MPELRYLDHAATSWPKPTEVSRAMVEALEIAGSAGRGGHAGALEGERRLALLRSSLARRIGVASPDRIVLTSGGTESLNLAFGSLLLPGAHVVTTAAEHNSVLRPLEERRRRGAGEFTVVPVDDQGCVGPDELRRAIRSETSLIALTHVSNVTGAIQPIEAAAEIAAAAGAALLVDAAQSCGELPIDFERLGIDLLAASGHKGLRGPAGSGLLAVSTRIADRLQPWKCGGTGSRSESLAMPDALPGRLEAGTPPLPALAGLAAAIESLPPIETELPRRRALTERLVAGLAPLPSIRIVGPTDVQRHHGPTSVTIDDWEPHDAAAVLESEFGIRVRAGRHCAAAIHPYLGTERRGGTLRITPGYATTDDDIDALIDALRTMLNVVR